MLDNVRQREKWPKKNFTSFTVKCLYSDLGETVGEYSKRKIGMSVKRKGGGVSEVGGQIVSFVNCVN